VDKISLAVLLALAVFSLQAQPGSYTVSNAHSHNDYEQKVPFWLAYNEGFGSIEADIFLRQDSLVVAHSEKELSLHRTLETWYLDPLLASVRKHGGRPYPNGGGVLQVLIDLKTDSIHTLDRLVKVLEKYPELTGCPGIRFVITGNRPAASLWPSYPSWIWFDGVLSDEYDKAAMDKVAMLSDDFEVFSKWNGKGIVPAAEWGRLEAAVKKAHEMKKTVRFWDAPDFINAWYQFMHLGVDYINTDHIAALSEFLHHLPKTTYTGGDAYQPYQPSYKTDGVDRPVKNVILLIGDGTGLAQLYTGYTANRGGLNIFSMRNIGLSKTSSFGVDHTGKALPLLPAILDKKGIRMGLVSCGDIADTALNGRGGDRLLRAFHKTLDSMSHNKTGLFILTECAQIDNNGHTNDLPYVATEVLDFDRTVGEALRFADQDGETLVIVTADHETGGLTLLDGNYSKGYVAGQFSTNDHTAIPVPVFAYGPRSGLFRGVYENTAIFTKILQAYGL